MSMSESGYLEASGKETSKSTESFLKLSTQYEQVSKMEFSFEQIDEESLELDKQIEALMAQRAEQASMGPHSQEIVSMRGLKVALEGGRISINLREDGELVAKKIRHLVEQNTQLKETIAGYELNKNVQPELESMKTLINQFFSSIPLTQESFQDIGIKTAVNTNTL